MLKAISNIKYFVAILAIILVSCRPPAKPKCIVRVVDLNGTIVTGAIVNLTAPVANSIVSASGETGASGTVEFEFDNPVIMNVVVTKGAMSGTGLAKMEEDEVTNVEVTITP